MVNVVRGNSNAIQTPSPLLAVIKVNNFVSFQVTKKRRRAPLMLAETIDAGLLRTAAEKKNDERILVQIRGKTV